MFAATDGFQIARLTKGAELRISVLDDSVTAKDIRVAIQDETGCNADKNGLPPFAPV